VASGDLRLMPFVDEPPGPLRPNRTRCGSLGLQHLETRPIDRLERQRGLESFDRRGVELARRFQRAVALDFRAIALKTEPAWARRFARSGGVAKALPAFGAQRLRASAF
jgi:hypothetical protein